MKIVINDGYYGPEFKIPDYVLSVLKDSFAPEYKGKLSEHIQCIDILGATRYLFKYWNFTDAEIRTDEALINIVEDANPVGLKVIEIPDEATDWMVITDRHTDNEEVIYCLDGRLYVAPIYL